jgi:quercetin dioxygenase-like cupin family protein
MDEAAFGAALARRGAGPPILVHWAAGYARSLHSHSFEAHGLVVAGSFTLTTADGSTVLRAGDTFELGAGVPHAESAEEGASLLVAGLPAVIAATGRASPTGSSDADHAG